MAARGAREGLWLEQGHWVSRRGDHPSFVNFEPRAQPYWFTRKAFITLWFIALMIRQERHDRARVHGVQQVAEKAIMHCLGTSDFVALLIGGKRREEPRMARQQCKTTARAS